MFAATLLTLLITAQPTKTTPIEVLKITRFNAALVDETLMHHWVDLTGYVTEIERDGIGGYTVKIEGRLHESDFLGRIEIICHFTGNYRTDLARVKPGAPLSVRGIFREVTDHLHFPIDRNVVFQMKSCELLVGAE